MPLRARAAACVDVIPLFLFRKTKCSHIKEKQKKTKRYGQARHKWSRNEQDKKKLHCEV